MIIETVVVGALQVNCYVLGCEHTAEAAVVDPGDNARAILDVLQRRGLALRQILLTHAHFDHVMAARSLQQATQAGFYLSAAERPLLKSMQDVSVAWLGHDPGAPAEVTGELVPGQVLMVGQQPLEVRGTPGHSPGGLTFVDHAGRRALTGDALFAGSIGRTDLPGGDAATLLAAIRSQIMTLPDDYQILPGHGPASTVGFERENNPFLDPGQARYWT